MPGNFQIDVSDGRSPLSQLEEMKKQLPALAEQAKGLIFSILIYLAE